MTTEELRAALQRLNLSEVARAIRCHRNTLDRFARGRGDIHSQTADKLRDYLESNDDEGATTVTTTQKPAKQRARQPIEVANVPDALLTMETSAAIAGCSSATLRKAAAAGKLKLIKLGWRTTRIRAADLMAYLSSLG